MTRWLLLASLAALPVLPVAAYDDDDYEPPPDKDAVELVMGYQGSSTDDALDRVAEYDVVDPSSLTGLAWRTSPYDPVLLRIEFERLGHEQLSGAAVLDLNRKLRVEASADGLLHRLDHDPISNLQAVEGIKVTRRTDLEPGAQYRITRRLYELDAKFQHPEVTGLTWRAGYREQQREGTRQLLSTGHCTSCHTVSQGREVDRSTTEGTFGFHLRRGTVDLDYEVQTRSFEERGPTPTAPYEQAFRPETPNMGPTLIQPFQDRVWFQGDESDLLLDEFSVDRVPDVKRTAHQLKLRAATGKGRALNLTILQSRTENRTSDLDYDFLALRGSYTWRVNDDLRLNFFARRDELENDSVFIDLESIFGPAPTQGYPEGFGTVTFQEWRDGIFALDPTRPSLEFNAYTRNSGMDRTDSRLGMDGSWRPWRRASLRFGYEYRVVDRDNVVLADGDGETKTHRISLGWNQRILKRLRWDNSFVYTDADNPYLNVDGAWRVFAGYRLDGFVVGRSPTPPGGSGPRGTDSLQYYELHALRQADVSNVPATQWRLRSNVRWSPKGTWALSGNVRLRDAENDELDFSTWEQDVFGVGANLWVATGPKFHLTLGIDHITQETEAFAAVPIMDG